MKHIFTKKIKARDPVTGEFEGINAFAAESTEEYLAKIQKKGEDTLADVGAEMDAHGQRVLDSLPEEYTNLVVQTTGDSKTQVMSQKGVTHEVSQLWDILPNSTITGTNISVNSDDERKAVIFADEPTEIHHCSKNLLAHPYDTETAAGSFSSSYNITYAKNEDGSLHISGTATGRSTFDFVATANTKRRSIKKGTYTFSGCPDGGGSTYRSIIGITGVGEFNDDGNGVTFTVEEDTTYYSYFVVYNGVTVDHDVFPMLEKSDIKTEWEAYHGETINYNDGEETILLYKGINNFISDSEFTLMQYMPEYPVYNIKDFGAVGDGVTDDTEAINTVLTRATNKILYVPEGVYLFSGTLHIHSGTKIIGCGENSVFKLADTFELDAVSWRPDTYNALYKYPMIVLDADSNGCELRNFTLIGSSVSWKDENEDGITVRGSNHILENLVVHGINYSNANFGGRWCLCPAWGINIFKANNVSVRNCHVYDCGYENIGTEEAETVTISDCRFGDACQTSSQIHRYSKHIKFYGNTVYHTENIRYKDCPAFTMDASIGVDMDDICVINNSFGCHVNTVAGGENNIKIIGNTIDGIMYTNTTDNYAQGLMICNNIINGRINMRADNVIVANNIINNDTEMPMARIYGNSVEMNGNLGIGVGKSTVAVEH